jgi:hypothetical protein
MSNQVYANGQEVSCKAAAGKSVCAFPDVCLSPPSPPAGPVPIPYPNTGMASDTTSGSKTVKVSGQEVMLKNKSHFKKSTGDEAATKSLGMGVVTHQITGKVYFTSWSMNVIFEGENAVRHLDLTTHNHMSMPGNTPTWPYVDEMAMPSGDACQEERKATESKCGGKSPEEQCEDEGCKQAKKCMLVPYKPKDAQSGCCEKPPPKETPHHLVEAHGFCHPGKPTGRPMPQFPNYDYNQAPCVCAVGGRYDGTHGDLHAVQGVFERGAIAGAPANRKHMAWNYGQARDAGIKAHRATFGPGCSEQCLAAQLDNYHQQPGMDVTDKTPLRTELPPLRHATATEPSQWIRGLQLLDGL